MLEKIIDLDDMSNLDRFDVIRCAINEIIDWINEYESVKWEIFEEYLKIGMREKNKNNTNT